MQRNGRSVKNSLEKKGFIVDNRHHKMFIYHTIDGHRSSVMTRMSHGSNRSIDNSLIGQMAKQCKLTKNEFLDLIDCPLSRETYEEQLRQGNHILQSEVSDK